MVISARFGVKQAQKLQGVGAKRQRGSCVIGQGKTIAAYSDAACSEMKTVVIFNSVERQYGVAGIKVPICSEIGAGAVLLYAVVQKLLVGYWVNNDKL